MWKETDQVPVHAFESILPTNIFVKRAILDLHEQANKNATQTPSIRMVFHTEEQSLFAHKPFQPIELLPKEPENATQATLRAKDGTYEWKEPKLPNYDLLPQVENMSLLKIFGGRAMAVTLSEATLRVVPENLKRRLDPTDGFPDICAPSTLASCLQAKDEFWDSDKAFALKRFQGPNPTKIRQVSRDVLSEEKLPHMLQPDRKYYLLDYSHLGTYDTKLGFKLAPKAVFSDNKTGDMCVECVDLGNGIVSTMVDDHSWRWRYCKMIVEVAEFSHQEVISHLTQTHLVAECVIMATMSVFRNENSNILYQLLVPCFSRTLAVNKGAREVLIPWIKNHLTPFTPESVDKMIADTYKDFDCAELNFETLLRNRGFDLQNLPTQHYFAKDGLAIWAALLKFVRMQLAGAQLDNFQIQEWSDRIREDLPSFPETLSQSRLAEMVAGIIFLSSVIHSAYNDPQYYFFGSGFTAPASLMKPIPSLEESKHMSNDEWKQLYFDSLPSIDAMQFQRDLVSLLALGPVEMGSMWNMLRDYMSFFTERDANLAKLGDALEYINEDIQERGEYLWLMPKQLTRSVIR